MLSHYNRSGRQQAASRDPSLDSFLVADALAAGCTRRQVRTTQLHTPIRGVRMDKTLAEDLDAVCAAVELTFSPVMPSPTRRRPPCGAFRYPPRST
ncbi:hypothetical protein NKG05_20280 [Oerskovia sp. M15]